MNQLAKRQNSSIALPKSQTEFLKNHTVVCCMKKFNKANTASLAIKSEAPTLASLRKTYSEDFMLAYIELWLVNLNDFINVSRKMKPDQMSELAFLIFQDFYYFNLADINLVFSKIKKGEFGILYESIDGVKILSFFKQYEAERIDISYDEGIQEHQQIKQAEPITRHGNQQIKEAFKRARGYELQLNAKK